MQVHVHVPCDRPSSTVYAAVIGRCPAGSGGGDVAEDAPKFDVKIRVLREGAIPLDARGEDPGVVHLYIQRMHACWGLPLPRFFPRDPAAFAALLEEMGEWTTDEEEDRNCWVQVTRSA